ncbi:hypothetical protein COLO4_16357 [Corchorus olitorius]|uniref:FBD domain-containing protein n=1 Tax=Corchorus olitorius TaxID=93759 RepID=A0A1R3JHZ0_9ROSI|nr:hypothetical protein COLO4_16357 [Corchorus olitorius]
MKEAVGTLVLSKQWKKFWTNHVLDLKTLDFDSDHFRRRWNNRTLFVNYVDRVLRLRGPRFNRNVEEFSLKYNGLRDDLHRVSRWIRYAARCKVQKLELDLYGNQPFGGQESYRFQISAPTLKTLNITLFSPDEFQRCSQHIFIIQTPNLEYLTIDDTIFASYQIPEIPSLVEANIANIGPNSGFINNGEISRVEARRVMLLLQGIRHARKLSLWETATSALGHAFDAYGRLPEFQNLLRIELLIDNCYGWRLLPHFLSNSPNLEILQIDKQARFIEEGDEEVIPSEETYGWVEPVAVPSCLALRLKEIKMMALWRSGDEEDVIGYLLENGIYLERMIINFSKDYPSGVLDKDYIEEFPRGSDRCQLIFH